MGKIKRLIQRSERFFRQWRLYGFSIAFWSFLFTFNQKLGMFEPFVDAKKHWHILRYLYRRYGEIIDRFAKTSLENRAFIEPDCTIWACWWDGVEAMPTVVKACYDSICRHAGSHPVQIIDKRNVHDFISMPNYIYEKLEAGIITITHFSNMIRANLLYEYGGIWMDATILTLRDISFDNQSFYTLKAPAITDSISNSRFEGLTHAFKYERERNISDVSRWSGFLFAASKRNPTFDYMRAILYAYWKEHNDQIDYLLYDYTIALGYDTIPTMKNDIDIVPCSPVEKFVMEKNMNKPYSEETFARYAQTPFHKLTWKLSFKTYTKNRELTLYGYVVKDYI